MMGPLIIEHVRGLVENTVEIIWLSGLFNFYLVLQQIFNTHIYIYSFQKGFFFEEGWSSKVYAYNLLEFGAI